MGYFCEIQCVNLGDTWQFIFIDMGYFSKHLKGYGIQETPFQGLSSVASVCVCVCARARACVRACVRVCVCV